MKTLPLLAICALLSGCVQTQFSKSITIHKDATGRITGTSETESLTQPGSAMPVRFEHIKKWDGSKPASP